MSSKNQWGGKTYFASDLHFSHPNILVYEPQRIDATINYILDHELVYDPEDREELFSTQKQIILEAIRDKDYETWTDFLKFHNEMLIYNWNKVVKENDLVYFLGDFAFKDKTEAESLGRRLNGHKVIILGNHDNRKFNPDGSIKYNPNLEAHFKAAGFERVEFSPITLKGCFVLSHEPLYYSNESTPYFNIFGHVHSSPYFTTQSDYHFCACLDRHDYKPVQLKVYDDYNPMDIEDEEVKNKHETE